MMQFRLLGRSGLRVSEVSLGTMTFGDDWGWGADEATSKIIFDKYAAAGGNFIDTACNYTDGTSEQFVGKFVAGKRDEFVIATKYTLAMANGNTQDPHLGGNSRKAMVRTVEASLERLNTDYIDVLYLHMWDFTTPVEEVMRGVDDLIKRGLVHYFAFSDSPSWIITYAIALAERYGWTRPIAVQLPYNLVSRDPERALIPMARTFDLAVTAWAVIGGGALTGKYNTDSDDAKRYDDTSDKNKKAAEAVIALADELGRSPAQVAINWVRQQPGVIIPIIGARTEKQIDDNLAALEFKLTPEQLTRLDEVAGFDIGFPLRMITSEHVRGLIFGETYERIDNHRNVLRV